MKKRKKKNKKILERFNEAKAKKNAKVTALKTGVDLVGGIGLGTALGSVFGVWSPIIGLLVIGTGHILGDQSGIMRVAGASMSAYGLATVIENRTASKTSTVEGLSLSGTADGVKNRIAKLMNNWKHALYVDKFLSPKDKETISTAIDGLGNLDISELDALERLVENSSQQFNHNQQISLEAVGYNEEAEFSEQNYFEDETGELIPIHRGIEGIDDEDEPLSEYVDFSTM